MSKWFVSEGHPDHGIVDDQGRLVAMVTTDEDNPQEPEQVLANAKLIASSPDLLAACKDALDYFMSTRHGRDWRQNGGTEHELLAEAIAKAEGRGE